MGKQLKLIIDGKVKIIRDILEDSDERFTARYKGHEFDITPTEDGTYYPYYIYCEADGGEVCYDGYCDSPIATKEEAIIDCLKGSMLA